MLKGQAVHYEFTLDVIQDKQFVWHDAQTPDPTSKKLFVPQELTNLIKYIK